jgi:hypothetical protein
VSSSLRARANGLALPVGLALALGVASCGAAGPFVSGPPAPPPDRTPLEAFPPWAAAGPVRVEARYLLDQAELMGGDLLEDFGLVPVALRLGVVPTSSQAGRLSAVPEDMGLVLHLPDGTGLARVGPEDLDVRRRRLERLVREGFDGGLLPPWDSAREGFVYFALPTGARADSRELSVTVPAPGGTRTLDLRAALVSFQVVVAGERRPVRVGLQVDRRGSRLGREAP